MNTHVEFPHVLSHVGTTNTRVALGTHEVAQSNNHLLNLLTKKYQIYRREKTTYIKTQENDISILKYQAATTEVTTDNANRNGSIRKHNPQEMNLVVFCV
jgi:phosphoribosylformylglycinamidine (FGAM) synthase-like amidotransferase family enzyme